MYTVYSGLFRFEHDACMTFTGTECIVDKLCHFSVFGKHNAHLLNCWNILSTRLEFHLLTFGLSYKVKYQKWHAYACLWDLSMWHAKMQVATFYSSSGVSTGIHWGYSRIQCYCIDTSCWILSSQKQFQHPFQMTSRTWRIKY